MKKFLIIIFISIISISAQNAPFSRGVNLTEWLQTGSPQQTHFGKYTKQDFENIKSLGCDVIRLPVHLHNMTLGAPDYTVDPLLFFFLDHAVQWAEETGLHLIIDNHSFDSSINTSPDVGDTLIPVWTQIAERYKDSYANIYYEVLNEPHGIDDATWNTIQGQAIDAIRQADTTHYIIVGPAGWNSYNNLQYMPEYEDDKLIYTFHYYDPFIFTHQGASWTDPSMASLSGVPFPYNASDMPSCPQDLLGTWIESTLNNYNSDGTVSHIMQPFNIVRQFQQERNVPMFCGEFGVYINNSPQDDRVYWYQVIKNILESNGFAWTIWDYHGVFGIFEQGTSGLFEHDVNVPMIEALGLNPPAQSEFELKPDTTAFIMYDDYFSTDLHASATAIANFYDESEPYNGLYSLKVSGGNRYSNISMYFAPIKDLTRLEAENYIFECYVKGDSHGSSMDIRFVDTKTGPDDHPWRMGFTLNSNMVSWDGNWHKISVPLSEFQEKGSWDNGAWFDPQGKFDWGAIDHFQLVAEHHDFNGRNFWFDDIKIYNPNAVGVDDGKNTPDKFVLEQNYPNPFNPSTKINYGIGEAGTVNISVYDVLGQKIKQLVNEHKPAGNYSISFNANDLPGGIYFYRMDINNHSSIRKMVLLK